VDRRLVTRWRLLVALSAVLTTLALVGVWASFTHGILQGSVTLAGGCRDIAKPDAPTKADCTSTQVNGATVVVSSADGVTLNVHTDDRGMYRVILPAGTYMVAAWVSRWQGITANGRRGIPITGEASFMQVHVDRWAIAHLDVAIAWYAVQSG
jgi:hypothetical protein